MQRTLWMFPRNKRKIPPLSAGLILRAFSSALSKTSDSSTKSQDFQDAIIEELNDLLLKAGQDLQHSKSGGWRTYEAYFDQAGLIFQSGKSRYLTLAGKEIAELTDPTSVLRKQILRMQFPSPYSQRPNVNISPSVNVQPAIFAAEMAQSPDLNNFVSDTDLAIAAIYGRTANDLTKVISKCVQARSIFSSLKSGTSKEKRILCLKKILDVPRLDLYTPTMDKKPLDNKIWEAHEVGNCLRNRLESVDILLADPSIQGPFGGDAYILNTQFIKDVQDIKNEGIQLASVHKKPEAWARRLGRGNSARDQRVDITCQNYNTSTPENYIIQETIKTHSLYGILFNQDLFSSKLAQKFNLKKDYVQEIVDKILPSYRSNIERQLISSGYDSGNSDVFEVNIESYLRLYFSNSNIENTAKQIRQDKKKTSHNFQDILFTCNDGSVIQIDAKSTKKEYAYSASEQDKSEDYVKYPVGYPKNNIKCFVIIAPKFSKGAVGNAIKSENRTGVPFKLVQTDQLIHIVKQTKPSDKSFLLEILKS